MTSSETSSAAFRSPSPSSAAPDLRDRLSFSPRLFAFLALSAAALALGALERKPLLLAAGEAGLALVALLFLYGRIAARGLAVHRSMVPRAYEGDAVDVTLRLGNGSRLPLFMLRVVDAFHASAEPARALLVGGVAPRGGAESFGYTAVCDRGRGRFRIGHVTLHVPDPLGFFIRTRHFPSAVSELLVLPRTFPIRRHFLEGLRSASDASVDTPARSGESCTFMGTREYAPGDDIRHLHWRSSARWDRLVLKEFETIASREVSIFLDLSRAAVQGVLGHATLEVSIKIAASIAEHACLRSLPVRLFAHSREEVFAPAGSGPGHLMHLLETLAAVAPEGSVSLPDLVLSRLNALPEASTAVLLVHAPTRADAEALSAAVAGLARRRARVVAAVVDDASFVRLRAPEPGEAARRLEEVSAALAAGGAEVYRAAAGDSLRDLFARPALEGRPS
jgi:uncharacterized protein (DUF58 family)